MPMSEDELRRLRELEAELARERRMVNLAHRLGSASVDAGLQRVTALWIAGGSAGLILVVAGAVVQSAAVLTAALVVLAATLVLARLSSLRPKWPGTGRSIARSRSAALAVRLMKLTSRATAREAVTRLPHYLRRPWSAWVLVHTWSADPPPLPSVCPADLFCVRE